MRQAFSVYSKGGDLSAKVRALRTDDSLYFLFEVRDDALMHESGRAFWIGDSSYATPPLMVSASDTSISAPREANHESCQLASIVPVAAPAGVAFGSVRLSKTDQFAHSNVAISGSSSRSTSTRSRRSG